jgi:predicted ATPase/DNA-binding SARP family transcriptional activator
VQIAILGPLEVRTDTGAPVPVAGARLRDLIARLALAGGRPVGTAALINAVWPDEPPADAANALQTLVSRARRTLGGARTVEQSAAGYRLAVAPQDVDSHCFESLVAQGRTAQALALWRGPALADVGDFAAPDALRLHELRLDAQLTHLAAELEAGRAALHVGQLEALAAEHPLHERLAGLLIRALAATGRQAAALASYETLRARLADELGVDPGAELQAVHLDVLRGDVSPAPAARARPRTNLRAQLTSFVGREDEVTRIGKLLGEYRLVTLVGPGGAGKTRLAAEATARLVDDDALAADGVWFVELASVTDPADVPQTVLSSLGLREAQLLPDGTQKLTARDALSRLHEALADACTVLVLDNCEHLIDAAARLADSVLAAAPRVRVLATSREPLGIVGESLFVIAPLGQPAADTAAADALEYPAVRLFADRAGAVSPGFEVDDATAPLVIDIVRRLDGLPLAIELAAARLRTLPLAEIASRLSDRFRLLTGGSRTALPRHRTLRAVVEWSWDLLTADERLLAERFSVFPSGATPMAVAAVCGGDEPDELLASLVDKSLLQPLVGGGRLRMLETIREYGSEQLAARGEVAELRRVHAEYFTDLMLGIEPKLTTRDQLEYLKLATAERDNILAALRYWCDVADPEQAVSLAISVSSMAMLLGNHADVGQYLAEANAVPDPDGRIDPDMRTLSRAIYLLNTTIGADAAPAEDVERAMGELHALIGALDSLDVGRWPMAGLLRPAFAMFLADMELMDRYIDEAIAVGDPWLGAAVRMLRAAAAENSGDLPRLRADIATALDMARAVGERWVLGGVLRVVASLHALDGELEAAADAYREALRLLRELGSTEDEMYLQMRLADLALRGGDRAEARRLMARARDAAEENGSRMWGSFVLGANAMLELQAGDPATARELYERATAQLGPFSPAHPARSHPSAVVETAGVLLACAEGDPETARARAETAYAAAVDTKDGPLVALSGVAVAALAGLVDGPRRAAELLGAAAVVRGADDSTEPTIRDLTDRLTVALGPAAFAAAYGRGRELGGAAANPPPPPAQLG